MFQEDNLNYEDGASPLKKFKERMAPPLNSNHPRGYCGGKANPVSLEAGNETRHEELNRRQAKDGGPGYLDGPGCIKRTWRYPGRFRKVKGGEQELDYGRDSESC